MPTPRIQNGQPAPRRTFRQWLKKQKDKLINWLAEGDTDAIISDKDPVIGAIKKSDSIWFRFQIGSFIITLFRNLIGR
jgi:hypothetical protein